MQRLRYEKITRENIDVAMEILQVIAYSSYGIAYYELDKYFNAQGTINLQPYLIYLEDLPIGTTGFYDYGEPDEVWLWFFGILTEYRGRGLGKRILLDCINMAKKIAGKQVLRLYTYSAWNSSAQPLYNKYMQLCERYRNSKENAFCIKHREPIVYSVSLTADAPRPWKSRFLDLTGEYKNHEIGKEMLAGNRELNQSLDFLC